MTNLVVLMGLLVAEPEITAADEGSKYAKFTLAVKREYKNKEGIYEADFVNISAKDRLAEIVAAMTHKGSRVEVIGCIRVSSYTDKNGIRRKAFEIRANKIQLLDKKGTEKEEIFPALEEEAIIPF